MNSTTRPEDWRVLCAMAAKEPDPKKLLKLVQEINDALEWLESRRRITSLLAS
jgi:hypothetical protein